MFITQGIDMYVLNAGNNWMLSSYNIDTSNRNRNETTTTIKTKKTNNKTLNWTNRALSLLPLTSLKKNQIKKKSHRYIHSHTMKSTHTWWRDVNPPSLKKKIAKYSIIKKKNTCKSVLIFPHKNIHTNINLKQGRGWG